MKIILCNNILTGIVLFRKDVIEHFLNKEYQVSIIFAAASLKIAEAKKLPKDCKLIPVEMQQSGKNFLNDVLFFYSLLRIYRKQRPDIVFNYTIKPNIYSCIAAKLCGAKSVDMVAGLGYMFCGDSLWKKSGRLYYKIGLRTADRVIVLNEANYSTLLGRSFVKKEKLVLFQGGEGVNLRTYPYAPNRFTTIRFLMIARLLYSKGYSEFVEAAIIVKRKYPNVHIELMGGFAEDSPSGVSHSVIEQDIRDGRITYLGTTSDVVPVVCRDGVVVTIPSKYLEGLNRSLIEACAMGRPIITTDIPGCRETVEDGVNGYIVPQGDIHALADAMIRFIELPMEKKQAMARASYEKAVKQYDVTRVIEQYDNLVTDLTKMT